MTRAIKIPSWGRKATLKRSALYALVWAKPVTRIAAELGISDVGLAKACRRYAIPLPPRGYWAKLEACKNMERPPLPKPEADHEVELSSQPPDEYKTRREREKADRLAAAERGSELQPVDAGIAKPHPLVQATSKSLSVN